MPSCNSTEFTTNQVSVENFDDIGIFSGPYMKRIPMYSLTTEIKAASYGGVSLVDESSAYGHCGPIKQTLEMVDGSSIPSFIKLILPETEGSLNKKVYVYSTEKEQVGVYWLKIVTTLEDERYQDELVPYVEYFNVTVVEHPTSTVNYAAYPRVHLAERLSL